MRKSRRCHRPAFGAAERAEDALASVFTFARRTLPG